MKPNLVVLFALFAWSLASVATAQDKRDEEGEKPEEKVARLNTILNDSRLDTKDLPETLPLAKFLAALEGLLPEGQKTSLSLDTEAFGKDGTEIARLLIERPKVGKPSLQMLLTRAVSQVGKSFGEVEYGFRGNGIVITRPRLATHVQAYPVRDVVERMPLLRPQLKERDDRPRLRENQTTPDQDLPATDGMALLVRHLSNHVDLRPWETLQVQNGVRLVVLATPSRHDQIANLLEAWRNQADVAVVMNARLYEVDREFFVKNVASLFAPGKDQEERAPVARIDGPLLTKLVQQKLLLESEEVKILPGQDKPFLSQHSVVRYHAGPRLAEDERPPTGTCLTGGVVRGCTSSQCRPAVLAPPDHSTGQSTGWDRQDEEIGLCHRRGCGD